MSDADTYAASIICISLKFLAPRSIPFCVDAFFLCVTRCLVKDLVLLFFSA